MININGRVFSGDNVAIVNGRVINGGENAKPKKFDERKSEDCSNIDKILIDSTVVDVNVSVSNSSKIEAHFYGESEIDGDVNFDIQLINRELRITLQLIGNCYNGNLKLDITVPQKTFKVVSVKSSSANITLNEGISTEWLKVKTKSGDLETNATANNISISTMSGDIRIR